MASIVFTGPSLENPGKESSITVEVDDQLMLAAIDALCAVGFRDEIDDLLNVQPVKNDISPALFAVQRTVQWWSDITRSYTEKKAAKSDDVKKIVDAQVGAVTKALSKVIIK